MISAAPHEVSRPVRLASYLVLIPIALLVASWSLMYGFTPDDAFISFRYAENALGGHGLVFNLGERIEGYSNPIWVAILLAGSAAGIGIVLLAKVLGLVFAVIGLFFLERIATRGFRMLLLERLAMLSTFAITPHLAYYAASGLETTLYMAEVCALAYYLFHGTESEHDRDLLAASLVTGLAVLTRPEAPLLLLPLAVVSYFRKGSVIAVLRYILIPIACLVALVGFRFMYFGQLLPNTFNAKLGSDLGMIDLFLFKTKRFAEYSLESFDYLGFLPVLAVIGLLLLRKRAVPLVLLLFPLVLFVWIANGDWMGLGRFYLPVIALLFVLAFHAIASFDTLPNKAGWKTWSICAIPFVFALAGLVQARHQLGNNYELPSAMRSIEFAHLASYIERTTPTRAVIAAPEIGRIGFGNDRYILDMQGLTDTTISGMLTRGDLSNYTSYILGRRPQLVLLYDKETARDTAAYPLQLEMIAAMSATGEYVLDTVIPINYFKNVSIYRRIGS